MLETIEADADRVTRLITELLDVSRIDAGRLQIRPAAARRATRASSATSSASVATGHERERFVLDVPDATCPRCGPTPTGSTRSSPT